MEEKRKLNFGKGIDLLLIKRNIDKETLSIVSNVPLDIIEAIRDGVCNPSKEIVNSIVKAFDVESKLFLMLCVDRDTVPDDRKEAYDVLGESMDQILLSFLDDKEGE